MSFEIDPDTGEMIYAQLDDMDIRSEQRFDVLETEPQRLLQVPGVTESTLHKMVSSWSQQGLERREAQQQLAAARERAYALAEAVEWPDGFFRRDIGWRAL